MKWLLSMIAMALCAIILQYSYPSTATAGTVPSTLITLITSVQTDAGADVNDPAVIKTSWGNMKRIYFGDCVPTSSMTQDSTSAARMAKPGAVTNGMSSYSSYIASWKLPFCGSWQISCIYGCSSYHQGNDFFAVDWNLPGWNDFNQAVPAPAAGVVKYAGWRSGYGNTVEVDAGNQYFYRIAHLNSIGVSTGQWVNQGSYLGACGNSGASQGPHIHFAVYFPARWAGYIQKAGDNPWGHGMSVPQEGMSGQYSLREWSYYASGQYCQSR